MKIHVLQHASFEGPGEIGNWAALHGHALTIQHLYRGDSFPTLDSFDLLLVMGGEMNIYQDRDYPWLKAERAFIQSVLEKGKPAIGICLGAQFIADALGSRVVQNSEHELGWYPVVFTDESRAEYSHLPVSSSVLHWHGDTFGLPPGATRLASSDACPEQGYFIPGKCLGFQFHMEVDPALVNLYVEGQGTWPSGPHVQTPKAILDEASAHCERNKRYLVTMLDRFCAGL